MVTITTYQTSSTTWTPLTTSLVTNYWTNPLLKTQHLQQTGSDFFSRWQQVAAPQIMTSNLPSPFAHLLPQDSSDSTSLHTYRCTNPDGRVSCMKVTLSSG